MSDLLASQLVARAHELGFQLVGGADAAVYDLVARPPRRAGRRLPGAGTVVVLGTGGRAFWEALQAEGPLGPPDEAAHPIDAAGARRLQELVDWLAAQSVHAVPCLPDDEDALDFLWLAQRAGLGSVSPVMGLLLHPEFGPWISLRGALVIEGLPFGPLPDADPGFDPCSSCAKPCVSACPAGVFDGAGGVDLRACATHRLADHCGSGCDSRRACPVGADARYGPAEERFRHAYSLFAIRRFAAREPPS